MSSLFHRLVLLTLAAALSAGAAHAADPTSRVVYGGKVEDAQGRPIGGIYPLTFSFYRTAKGGKALWSESHFVAVDNGVYAVELGRDKPFPKALDFDKSFMGVSISGGKEIVREKFVSDPSLLPAPVAVTPKPQAPTDPQVGAPPQPAKGTYADLAGFAYEAEKAKSADALGGMTITDIKALVKQAETPREATSTKVRIGDAKRYTEQVGGSGGRPYTLECPPGFVVTGIRGQAAGYVDQIALICSPLE